MPPSGPRDAGNAADRDAAPSKSQRKRDMLALQALGESLLTLSDERLQRMPIPPELVDAVRMAREIRSHEGRRRQLQYVGKLMRGVDADALRAALSDETREQRVATATMHAAERWRERLLADEITLQNWLERYPETRTTVPALVERARRELAAGGAGRSYRELYRALRDRLSELES
ncbi:MAG: ribosome biogenesis factor YjgA [Burkholderiaceae bacterium]